MICISRKKFLMTTVLTLIFTLTLSGFSPVTKAKADNSIMQYQEEVKVFDKKQRNDNITQAINSLTPYAQEVMMEDLQKNGKTLNDVVSISKNYVYTKRNKNYNLVPIEKSDLKIIQGKISKERVSEYEKERVEKESESIASLISDSLQIKTANASQESIYNGMIVTTWAVDYTSGSGYGVRQKLFGVFNWLWDDNPNQSYQYNPSEDGEDIMTLTWAGDLTLENQRFAEVNITEYPWNPNITISNSGSNPKVTIADVAVNGGIGFKFKERYPLPQIAYNAKADSGQMYVYVHKNKKENEDANFKFTYTHTWKTADIGYSIQAGYNTAAGSINIAFPDKTTNFVTYDSFGM